MAISVSLHHKSTYSYDKPVQLGPHVVRLRPAPHCRTPILSYSLKIQPETHFLNWQQDPFGNYQARLVFPKELTTFVVEVDLVASMTAINPFDFFVEDSVTEYPFTYEPALLADLAPYLQLAKAGARVTDFVRGLEADFVGNGKEKKRTLDVIIEANNRVHNALRYDIRMEPGVFAPEETLERAHGSCRDFAWLLVQVLRRLGIAARFVSGYSIQLVADVKALDGPSGVTKDVTDLHAWAEAYLPGAGWIGFDATSGLACAEGHIPLACTPDPSNAAPISGGYNFTPSHPGEKVKDSFAHVMKIERVREEPRVTKPYTDEMWAAIQHAGRKVDEALIAGDVRLSMGGEPTFVSIDDPDGAEWNTEALGPTKKKLSEQLFHRMHGKFAPGGVLHHGQGKWYPGEPLPRWAMTCYYRKDGQPLWRRPELFARETSPKTDAATTLAFTRSLARRLEVGERHLLSAYEDMFYYLWRERRLPVNVDMLESHLDDAVERARLARVFEQGLSNVAGYVLPLEPVSDWNDGTNVRWRSGTWPVRGERFFLTPGDSPMGYRLPLDGLPWTPPESRRVLHEVDPFRPRVELQVPWGRPKDGEGEDDASKKARVQTPSDPPTPAPGVVRTALCTELRGGILHVFLPPLANPQAFVELAAAIEDSAASVGVPVRIEGYSPPRDPSIGQFAVTPDPGVIEVNIQPAYSWDELVSNTEILYEEARQTRLGTEKFMTDGRHTGTGGGNHVVMGGATPADSPLLRRPDLLRSLIGYFVNHPALSYMFSGLFLGPTSQAPRLDEARQDSIDELEIAFKQIDERGKGGPTPPWLVDRVFRHLLTDVTGNTHRTELCIDKLFSPDAASGRQGLLELRSFEMPPHARMSMAQQLILRGLVASFWEKPYTERPARWGTALQDRFALPHFLWQDLGDVVGDLRNAGFPFETSWFIPHYEFRFPISGEAAAAGIDLQLRQAIEPWHVLGEESSGGGQARYVDSSLERMQLRVRGYTDDRYVVACNGRRVPLHPTGVSGEYVAGIRFRAWQPPSALHPRIGVHAPLVIDIVDKWSQRSVGGCTYHVGHPGGGGRDDHPVNALEAEGRRLARFFAFGHTPGAQPAAYPIEVENARGFPLTLDLRRG